LKDIFIPITITHLYISSYVENLSIFRKSTFLQFSGLIHTCLAFKIIRLNNIGIYKPQFMGFSLLAHILRYANDRKHS